MESIPDATSSLLNFADVKRRAVSSRCYRVKVPTSNGTTFTPGNTMNLDLAGNMANSYYSMEQSYLLMTIKNSAAATNDFTLDGRVGGYGLINRLQVITGGQTISDITNFNKLAAALMTQNTGNEWSMNVGSNLIGSSVGGSAFGGLTVAGAAAGGTSERIALPFILTALANTTPQRYIPAFSRDMLRFRFYTETQALGGTATGAGAAPVITFEDVEAVMYIVELSPDAQALVNAMTGGVYNILCGDYRAANATFLGAGAATTQVFTLGFAVSSLERVIIVQQDAASQVAAKNSVSARITGTLEEYTLIINGEQLPSRPIRCDGTISTQGYGAESFAETLVAQHSLSDFSHNAQFSAVAGVGVANKAVLDGTGGNGDGTNEAKTGQFVAAVELESMAGKSSNLYSGISTIGAICQARMVYSAAPAITNSLVFYAQNTILLSLDMNGLGTYVVSV